MKTIVVEYNNGLKTHMVFDDEKAIEAFSKIARGASLYYLKNEFEFDELKDDFNPFEMKLYKGPGVYDNSCNFIGENEFDHKEEGMKIMLTSSNEKAQHTVELIQNINVIIKFPILG